MRVDPLEEAAVARVTLAMRAADRAEIFACRWRYDPLALVAQTMAISRLGAVAHADDGDPVAVVSAVEIVPGLFSLGMWATPRWREIAKPFSRWCRSDFKAALIGTGGRRAECWSHDAHVEAHAWLRWFGFKPETEPLLRGRSGERFVLFGWEVS